MKEEKLITFNEVGEDADYFMESTQPFGNLMMQYRCVMLEVRTKFEVFNNELSL